jgi:hypothetical protein
MSKTLERRALVSADHVAQQLGERERRVVFTEGTDDLCADREPAERSPDRGDNGGKPGDAASRRSSTTAFTAGSTASIRASSSSVSCRAEISLRFSMSAASVAD